MEVPGGTDVERGVFHDPPQPARRLVGGGGVALGPGPPGCRRGMKAMAGSSSQAVASAGQPNSGSEPNFMAVLPRLGRRRSGVAKARAPSRVASVTVSSSCRLCG